MTFNPAPILDARQGSPVGRLQWSKNGITIYDPNGGFIARIEHPADCHLFNGLVRDALRLISEQQQRRVDANKKNVTPVETHDATEGAPV